MTKEQLLPELIGLIAEIKKVDASTITENTNLRNKVEEGGANISSLEMSQIISRLEEKYDTYIKFIELMHVQTVGEAAKVMAEYC